MAQCTANTKNIRSHLKTEGRPTYVSVQVLFTVGHVFPRIGSRPEYCTSHIPGSSSLLITSIRRRSLIEARVSQPVYASISIQRLSLVFLPNGIGSRTLTNPLLSKNPQRRRQQGSPTSGAGERSDTDASDQAQRDHTTEREPPVY